MKLDHRSYIFQNLNGASGKYFVWVLVSQYFVYNSTDEVELKLLDNDTVAYNSLYDTSAAIYHGNGPSKVVSALFMGLNFNLKRFCSCFSVSLVTT